VGWIGGTLTRLVFDSRRYCTGRAKRGLSAAKRTDLSNRKTFRYTTLLELVAAIGGAGTYLGHVIGASRNKEAGIEPFGPLTPGVMLMGAAIWFGGVVAVCAAVLGVMIAIHGPPPH
jgi:hypothetical protein